MNITFDSVQNLGADELSALPKEQLLFCIQAALDDGDDDKCLVFEFVFTHFASILSLCEIDEIVCNQLIRPLKGSFDDTMEYAASVPADDLSTISDELIRQIQTILQLFVQLLQTINNKSNEMDIYCISHMKHTICNTLHFLSKTTANTLFQNHREIKTLLDSMQMIIINVIISSKCEFNGSNDDIKLFQKVLIDLIGLGSLQSDIKSTASTWKHISRLATGYHSIHRGIQQQHGQYDPIDATSDNSLVWLTICIENICKLIMKNMQTSLEKFPEYQKESMGFMKLTGFYQKILQTLSNVYRNDEFRGQKFIIQMSEMVFNVTNNCDANEVSDGFQSLCDGFSNVLNDIFNCDRFAIELLTNFHGNHIRVCLKIMKLLLQSSTVDNPRYLNYADFNIEQKNIIHHMFNVCIPKEMHQLYISPNLHTDLVQVCTGIWLKSNENQMLNTSLEQIMLEASLSEDVYRMPILVDIWTLYLRHTTTEIKLQYCQQWWRWTQQHISPITQTPSSVFIRKMLKYTLNLLSDVQRSQIMHDVELESVSHFEVVSHVSWAVHGDQLKFQKFGQQLVNRIKECFTKLDPRSTLVTNDECVELIKALSCFQLANIQSVQIFLSDPELSNCLADALPRLKVNRISIVLSTVLRMLLWQKHFCGTKFEALEIDHSDSLDMRKFYGLELSTLAKRNPNGVYNESRSIIDDMDDFVRARIQNAIPNIVLPGDNQTLQSNDHEIADYLHEILNVNQKFGCTTIECCINQNALFKQYFDKIVQEAKGLSTALGDNPHINLKQFSNEITYVNRLFCQLNNEIQ